MVKMWFMFIIKNSIKLYLKRGWIEKVANDECFPHYRGVFCLIATVAHLTEIVQYDDAEDFGYIDCHWLHWLKDVSSRIVDEHKHDQSAMTAIDLSLETSCCVTYITQNNMS